MPSRLRYAIIKPTRHPKYIPGQERGAGDMNLSRISPKLIIGIVLGIFFFASFSLRVFLPYDEIFGSELIKFSAVDGYIHMRLVDNIVHNFPAITNFDPYYIYPGGHVISNIHFSEWLLSFFIWIIGLGSPTQHTVDVVGVYFPVILAALTIIPVYFIGKTLFNRWVGVLAALLMAVFPGEYLGRTLLGFTDNPVTEVLFSTTALAFFILAIKAARERNLSLSHFIRRDWTTIRRPLIYSLFAGIFSGFYLISWTGALLFIFIITLYIIIQFVIDHLKKQSVEYLGIVNVVMILVACIIYIPLALNIIYTISMLLALLVPIALVGISWVLARQQIKPFYFPVSIVGLGVIVLGIFYAVSPGLLEAMITQFGIFNPTGLTGEITVEALPFLAPNSERVLSTAAAWGNYTTSFFLTPIYWSANALTWVPVIAIVPAMIAFGLWKKQSGKENTKMTFFILFLVMLVAVIVFWFFLPSSWKLWFPGFGIASLAILIYLFVKPESKNSSELYHILCVVGILILIMAILLLMTVQNVRSLALLPLVIIFGLFFWRPRDDKTLLFFLVWTLIILILTMAQRRYSYYLVVNMALLSAYLSWEIIWWGGIRKVFASQEEKQGKPQQAPELSRQSDYYDILGISRNVSRKQIKSTFRNITAKYHLTAVHTPEEEENFKEINQAYEVLVNPERRASYDRVLSGRSEKRKHKEGPKKGRSINTYYATSAIAIVAVLFLVFFPNISMSKQVAADPRYEPSDTWLNAMIWLRDNTPEPFGDPDAYYQLYEPPADGAYDYPESAYGVTSWWDYGYWIMRIGHRLPNAQGGQDPTRLKNVANLFISDDEAKIQELMATMDSSYVVVDYDSIDAFRGKFWAIARTAGRGSDDFFSVYLQQTQGYLEFKPYYEPDYYRTTAARLFNFDSKAVTEIQPIVIQYREITDDKGKVYKMIVDQKTFTDYQEALTYVESEGPENHRIVGDNPFVSPVPLEALDDFELVYTADTGITQQGMGLIPGVKIFKYNGQ